MLTTLEPGGIRGAKRCVNRNGAVTFTPTVCSHSIDVISVNGFTIAMPALFTSKSIGVPADFGDEIGNATRRREIVNQWHHLRTLRLDNFARLRERHCVASVQQQFHIFASEFFRNGAADPAAGACDEISFHLPRKRRTPDTQRPMPISKW